MESQLIAAGGFGALLMGITLGVFGAGGSILTVPLLTFLFAYPPTMSSHFSLLVVGCVGAFGVTLQWWKGEFKLGRAVEFALPAMIGMFLVKKILLPSLPPVFSFAHYSFTLDQLILSAFAVFMILAAGSMIFVDIQSEEKANRSNWKKMLLLGSTGILTGGISGFVGAGGGFLIVPALVFFSGLPVKDASRASLLVIALNSLWGFVVGTSDWTSIPFATLLLVIAFALLGMVLGIQLQNRIPSARLKPAFGVFVFLMGMYILFRVS